MFKATAFGLDELNEIYLFYFYFIFVGFIIYTLISKVPQGLSLKGTIVSFFWNSL